MAEEEDYASSSDMEEEDMSGFYLSDREEDVLEETVLQGLESQCEEDCHWSVSSVITKESLLAAQEIEHVILDESDHHVVGYVVVLSADHTWSNIAGHSCGRFKEDIAKRTERARRDLYRYMHYHNRTRPTQIPFNQEKQSQGKYPGKNILYRKDEMTPQERDLKQNLFEDQQQQLEANVEKLSMFLEKEFQTFSDDEAGILVVGFWLFQRSWMRVDAHHPHGNEFPRDVAGGAMPFDLNMPPGSYWTMAVILGACICNCTALTWTSNGY
ncbi:hypothetical protein J5N97_010059 [Dioscorea zingiberensis]|uniref:Ariadne domain-containing protein n=1 Tax=Dioscorea zingiberensis TaxID=325984 RepID=A0A9D5CZI4_9LILI|nr:hypothetical protein J5N97_010059 [Dioscorea zingiberensis]